MRARTFDAEFDLLVAEEKRRLERLDLPYAELLHYAALMSWYALETKKRNDELLILIAEDEQMQQAVSSEIKVCNKKLLSAVQEMQSAARKAMVDALVKGVKLQKKAHATRAANLRHSKPGGSRDKARQMRELWASGKYSTKDVCAEQECAALGMSFSAARKALRETPNVT